MLHFGKVGIVSHYNGVNADHMRAKRGWKYDQPVHAWAYSDDDTLLTSNEKYPDTQDYIKLLKDRIRQKCSQDQRFSKVYYAVSSGRPVDEQDWRYYSQEKRLLERQTSKDYQQQCYGRVDFVLNP